MVEPGRNQLGTKIGGNLGNILGKNKQRQDRTEEQIGFVDAATFFEVPTDTVLANMANIRINFQQITGSDLIWGNTTFGIWGSFLWSNSFTGSLERQIELSLFFEINEDFSTTTREDGSFTTASGWGTGEVFFGSPTLVPISFLTGSATIDVGQSVGSIALLPG